MRGLGLKQYSSESFKGRHRLKTLKSERMWQPPRARAWSFAAQTYNEERIPSIELTKSANEAIPISLTPNSGVAANFVGKCPPGPPGKPGLPGIDGG